MNYAAGAFGFEAAAVHLFIGGLHSEEENECAANTAFLQYYEKLILFYIITKQLLWRVNVSPLGSISRLRHKLTRYRIDTENIGHIGFLGGSYHGVQLLFYYSTTKICILKEKTTPQGGFYFY